MLDSSSGRYELTSCPAGYDMKTQEEQGSVDLQECFKCPSPSTYILNPDVDACMDCPPGLTCSGDATLAPKIDGSVWVEQGSFFKLESCPAGYYVFPALVDTLSLGTAAQQTCLFCEKVCSLCSLSYFHVVFCCFCLGCFCVFRFLDTRHGQRFLDDKGIGTNVNARLQCPG